MARCFAMVSATKADAGTEVRASDQDVARPRGFAIVTVDVQRVSLLVMAALMLSVALLAALYRPMHADNLLYLHGAGRLLDGAKIYRDIVDMNPPATFLVHTVPVLLARVTGLATHDALAIVTVGLVILACLACYQMLAADASAQPGLEVTLLVAMIFGLACLPSKNFAQREHWIALPMIPYAVAVALRVGRRRLSAMMVIAIAAALSMAILMKPFYVTVWIGLEAYAWFQLRSPLRTAVWHSMPVLFGLAIGALITLLAFPDYIHIAQLASRYYQAGFRNSLFDILYRPSVRVWVFGAALAWGLPYRTQTQILRDALGVTSLMALLGAFLQQKGWDYHFIPALSTLVVWVAVAIHDTLAHGKHVLWGGLANTAYLVLAAATFCGVTALRPLRLMRVGGSRAALWQTPLTQMVAQCGPQPKVFGMALDLRATWTMVHYSGARWVSRYYHPWPLAGLSKEGVEPRGVRDGIASDSAELAKAVHDQIASDILASQPDVLVLDFAQMVCPGWGLPLGWDEEEYLLSHPKLKSLFQNYTTLGEYGFLRVYGRTDRCIVAEGHGA